MHVDVAIGVCAGIVVYSSVFRPLQKILVQLVILYILFSMGERRNAYRALVGKPEGRRPLGRPRRRWEDNIKMDLRDVGWGAADWIDLAQDRDRWRAFVYTVMNLRVP
jgi:hypothetical protein